MIETNRQGDVWVFAEQQGGALEDVALELSGKALELAGVLGVKTLEAGNTVGFHPIRILESVPGGVWIDGLPEQVTLITVGQEFVAVGQAVRPIDEQSIDQAAGAGGPS